MTAKLPGHGRKTTICPYCACRFPAAPSWPCRAAAGNRKTAGFKYSFREGRFLGKKSTLVVQLKKPASDIETMDLRLTEYRVEGGDVSSIESVDIIDKGERHEAQLGVDG